MIPQPILRLALPTPLRRLFDYLPATNMNIDKIQPGMRVRVPFQARTIIGVVVEVAQQSSVPIEKLRQTLELIDDMPLFPQDVYQLCQWAADYYHHAFGEILASALPTLLRKGHAPIYKPSKPNKKTTKKIEAASDKTNEKDEKPLILNVAQQAAVTAICATQQQFRVFLLDGITGSGKTEVYLRVMAETLNANKQILMLVPEISLTPQTIARFQARFKVMITTLHSGLSEQDRLRAWLQARNGEARIIIGTRSAVFTPFANLGLIIIDEEHDASFKQQDRFRYHARDMAIMRANMLHIPIVLGSATPSLESILNVKRGRYDYLSLPIRAGDASVPQYQFIDLRRTKMEGGIAPALLTAMTAHLQENNQVLLFLNKRGFSPVLYCAACQWIAECKRCDARMVYHRTSECERLHCHHCDARHALPEQCEKCHEKNLLPIGIGTQRLEQTLAKHFPDIPIIRLDRDNTRRKNAVQDLLAQIHTEKKAILLGTQMLAKGHHFPNVTLVGVIDADSGLFSADFRATEQMGQLLLQVAGRAGRATKAGTVMLQTRHPEHPLLQLLIHQGYAAFSQTLLAEREQATLPPFSHFAIMRAHAYSEEQAQQFLVEIKKLGMEMVGADDAVKLLGPIPATMAKRKGLYCQHLLIKAGRRQLLQPFLRQLLQQMEAMTIAHSVKWVLDVDPVEVG